MHNALKKWYGFWTNKGTYTSHTLDAQKLFIICMAQGINITDEVKKALYSIWVSQDVSNRTGASLVSFGLYGYDAVTGNARQRLRTDSTLQSQVDFNRRSGNLPPVYN